MEKAHRSVKISVGEGRYEVWGEMSLLGEDVVIQVGGGDAPHIGCVAVAIPRESRKEKNVTSTTSSVFNIVGHKDEVVIRNIAEKVCRSINRVVLCVGGIHVENADQEEIDLLVSNGEELAEALVLEVKKLVE